MVFQMIGFQKLPDVLFRKSKLLIKTGICDGKNLKIIQPHKNTFFGNAQTSG